MKYEINFCYPPQADGIIPSGKKYPAAVFDLADVAFAMLRDGGDNRATDPIEPSPEQLDALIGLAVALVDEFVVDYQEKLYAVEKDGVVVRLADVSIDESDEDFADGETLRPLRDSEVRAICGADELITEPCVVWDYDNDRPAWLHRLPSELQWVWERHVIAAYGLWMLELACRAINEGNTLEAVDLIAQGGAAVMCADYFRGWVDSVTERGEANKELGARGARVRWKARDEARDLVRSRWNDGTGWAGSKRSFARSVIPDVLQVFAAHNSRLSQDRAIATIEGWLR